MYREGASHRTRPGPSFNARLDYSELKLSVPTRVTDVVGKINVVGKMTSLPEKRDIMPRCSRTNRPQEVGP